MSDVLEYSIESKQMAVFCPFTHIKLEHHSREDGWRVSGMRLIGVCVEFSIGIHYLHSAFPHWSENQKM